MAALCDGGPQSPSARRRKALRCQRRRRGAGHIVAAARLQFVTFAVVVIAIAADG